MKSLLLLLLLSLALATESFACRCAVSASEETFLQEKFEASTVVLSARVEFVKDSLTKGDHLMSSDPTYWRKGGYHAVLKVDHVYKGEIKADVVEIIPPWSNCSQYFKTGDRYIIFGSLNKKGELTTNRCAGNFPAAQAGRRKLFEKIVKG